MKRITLFTITAVLFGFGLLTIFMSSAVIFDLFNIRAHQGHYVPFIVWVNFFSGILYVVAGYAFLKGKRWSARPLVVSFAFLGIALAGLAMHINAGGAYETKTVAAMIFRLAVNAVMAFIVYASAGKYQTSGLTKASVLATLPLILLALACGHRNDATHGHEHEHHDETSHHHEAMTGPLVLNNGKKWQADLHTMSLVEEMKSELSRFATSEDGSHHVLADSLMQQLNRLIVGCTMEGRAHDELHKWLVPVTKGITDLGAVEDPAEARAGISNIESHLEEFDAYFEGPNN